MARPGFQAGLPALNRKYPYEEWLKEAVRRVKDGEHLTMMGFATEKAKATGGSMEAIRHYMMDHQWQEHFEESAVQGRMEKGKTAEAAQQATLLRDRQAITSARRTILRHVARMVKARGKGKKRVVPDLRTLRSAANILHEASEDVEAQLEAQAKGDGGKFGLSKISVEVDTTKAPYATVNIGFAPVGKSSPEPSRTKEARERGAGHPQDDQRLPDADVVDASFTASGDGGVHGAVPQPVEAERVGGVEQLAGKATDQGQDRGERDRPDDSADRREGAGPDRAGQVRASSGDSPAGDSQRRGVESQEGGVSGSLGTGQPEPQGTGVGHHDTAGAQLVGEPVERGDGAGPGSGVLEDTSGRRGDGVESGPTRGTSSVDGGHVRAGVGGGVHGDRRGTGVSGVHREGVAGGPPDPAGAGASGTGEGRLPTGVSGLGVCGDGGVAVAVGDKERGRDRRG